MFLRFRTYVVLILLCVLWHSCKDPLPVVFQQDVTDQIGPFESLSTPNPVAAMLTTVDSSGWRIIDTAYTAMALLSDIRFDSGSVHRHLVLSKIIIQDKDQPVFTSGQSQFVGFKGLQLGEAFAGVVLMRRENRRPIGGISDTALGFQYTALNIDNAGPDADLHYPSSGVFNWTIQLPGRPAADIGGIPSEIIRVVQPSPDSITRIDRSLDYTVKWLGPNNSVDLVISDYGGGVAAPKKHVNFQRATSDTVSISADLMTPLPPGLYLFTFSASTEASSEIYGIPITMRFSSVHNVMVRLQ